MRKGMLRSVAVASLWLMACSDRDDDPFQPTEPGADPSTAVDGSATPPPPTGSMFDGGSHLIDASLWDGGDPTGRADSGVDASTLAERAHDLRAFTFDVNVQAPFLPLPGVETDRWSGVLDGAGYRVEVPRKWNGILVLYAHGYRGTGSALRVSDPSIRKHLIDQGYAWAASSYSTNYYDVRSGIEDTNKLALAFDQISAENGRPLSPAKRYIIGHSMGGHVAGAAVERETIATAKYPVKYDAALPMCGVMADVELFDYFSAYMVAAHHLAGLPVTATPFPDYPAARSQVQAALFTAFPGTPTSQGETLKTIVMSLTGGPRPVFELGFANKGLQDTVWGTFGGDGTINGILSKSGVDTTDVIYQLDADPVLSDVERAFNAQVYRLTATSDANPRRSDGVRWIPTLNGEFDVPVLALHTLGDLYVPFSMQQIYRRRAEAKGNGIRLVQRAMRAIGHCEFTVAEQQSAFDALAAWEQEGVKPEGDDVLDSSLVREPSYGCRFTDNTLGADELAAMSPIATSRSLVPACLAK